MHATFWVTTKCNMRCKYCYEANMNELDDMTREVAEEAITYIFREMQNNSDSELQVRFHGGEPLLNTDIIRYLCESINKKFKGFDLTFSITTNGTVQTEEAKMVLCKHMDDISISIDGEKKYNDSFRVYKSGDGTYDDAMEMALFLKSTIPIDRLNIRMTYNSDTAGYLSGNIIHFIDSGFTEIIPAPDMWDSSWTIESILDIEKQLLIVKEYVDKIGKDINVGGFFDRSYTRIGKCQGGTTSIQIMPNGDLYPCSFSTNCEELCIGSVFKKTANHNIEKLKQIYDEENTVCAGCSFYSCCKNTRCKLINYALTGDFFEPSWIACEIEKLEYRLSKNHVSNREEAI